MIFNGQSKSTGGGSDEPIDKILFDRYFSDTKYGIAIECGANDGLYLSTCLIFKELGWTVYNIEASIENFNKLLKNRKDSINYFYALSNKDHVEVNMHNYNGDNGGMNGLMNYQDVQGRFGQPSITTVKTITYDTLFRNIDVDLLVLDVEGHELEAIQGINFVNNSPKVMCIEHNRVGINNLNKLIIDNNYSSRRYKLDFIDELNAIYVLI